MRKGVLVALGFSVWSGGVVLLVAQSFYITLACAARRVGRRFTSLWSEVLS